MKIKRQRTKTIISKRNYIVLWHYFGFNSRLHEMLMSVCFICLCNSSTQLTANCVALAILINENATTITLTKTRFKTKKTLVHASFFAIACTLPLRIYDSLIKWATVQTSKKSISKLSDMGSIHSLTPFIAHQYPNRDIDI